MSYPTQNTVSNALPGTGVFGFGQVQVFGVSGTFTLPPGVSNVRVRLWGAGGAEAGGGGGFAMRTIFNLPGQGVSAVAVTVPGVTAGSGGTASFGSFVSATGGIPFGSGGNGGTGFGGDINTSGGAALATNAGGGGAGSLWGNGGRGGVNGTTTSGASGGGANQSYSGGSGLSGGGGFNDTAKIATPQTTMGSIDWIGTGGGGSVNQNGVNGGGGGQSAGAGGFPGGGGGSSGGRGAPGLVIVEY